MNNSGGIRAALRRVAPAFLLFFLSPLVAEFLLGNMSIDALGLLLPLAPLYGGGALLIREVTRRTGRGWPTLLLLALAYGLVEEGLAIQTLFNPSYLGFHLLQEAALPVLGMGAWWTLFVLTLHVVWSVSVPIAMVEALTPTRETRPWLGRFGLAVAAVLYAFGAFMVHTFTHRQDPFTASSAQLIGTAIAVLLTLVAAFVLKPRSDVSQVSGAPRPIAAGAACFLLGAAFMAAHYFVKGWPVVAVYVALYAVAGVTLRLWSRKSDWTPRHRLAVASGLLMTYAANSFVQSPVVGSKGTVALIGNAVFTLGAIALILSAARAQRRAA
ncbi:hypothetical protein DB347_08785 [Opitutaceae bacterium EW11]|nr:hypothetical protein DB347_08785 [Opitutaceae bacterium EW11]